MAITPNDILSKTFERSFRGYDEDQVDEFLDALKEEIERINEENHLLMGQIMNLEEEVQTNRQDGGNTAQRIEASSGGDSDAARAGIDSAKATAARIISDAKETAENIIQAANKKATEMMNRIESERTRSAGAAQQAGGAPNLDEAQQKAAEMMEIAKQRATAMMARAKSEAEEQARLIVESAQAKAAAAESDMNTKMADSRQQLESIQNAVKVYKSKLESFINGQAQAFKGFDPQVPGFDPKELNTPQVFAEPAVPAASAPAYQEPAVKAPAEPERASSFQFSAEPDMEPPVPKYRPYQSSDNDRGFADDLKFSGFDFGAQKAAPAPAMPEEKPPTVTSVLSSGAAPKPAFEPEPEPERKVRTTDDSDERYRQVLNQIRNIEKTKDELKSQNDATHIDSVNPVRDMTGRVESISHKSGGDSGSGVIISDDDEFVEKISAAAPVEWDEPVPMSDDEKRHLREMLDDML